MEVTVRECAADQCQLLFVKTAHDGLHHRGQRNVLSGIVDDAQHVEHGLDLVGVEIATAQHSAAGDPLFLQHILIHIRPAIHGTHENDHIRIADRPQLSGLLIRHLQLPHQCPDPVCTDFRFQLSRRPAILPCIRPVIQKQYLRLLLLSGRIDRSRVERRCVIIGNGPQIRLHQLPEQEVYTFQHLLPASEILLQINAKAAFLPRTIPVILLNEQLRPCQPEAVDTLLHIPHHKQVVQPSAFPGNAVQQNLLHQVAVLIFINEDLPVTGGIGPCRIGGPPVLPAENLHSIVLQIRKIHQILLPLGFLIGMQETKSDPHENIRCPGTFLHNFLHLLFILGKIFLFQIINA